MIVCKWYPTASYNPLEEYLVQLEQVVENLFLFGPLIVRTKEELDYLLGMSLMHGVNLEAVLCQPVHNNITKWQGTYFSIEGLPPS